MRKSLRFFLSLFFLLEAESASLFCQSPDISFRHHNINNGLSQNTVRSIFQDNQGFMWFGTKDGLNRFDGSSFKIFKFSPDSKLKDNVFTRIVQDKNGNLWLGTDDGVYIYDPRKDQFEQFGQTATGGISLNGIVSDLLLDDDGDVWIAVEEKGVFLYDFDTDRLTNYAIPSIPEGMKMITLCAEKDGVWVFPYDIPFMRINKETGNISQFQLNDDPDLLYKLGEVGKVKNDEYNQLLISSSTQGLISINTVSKTHHVLLNKDSSGNQIFVRCLEKVDPHTVWVGSESGLYIYDTQTGHAINLRHNALVTSSISDNAIYSIYKDKNCGIWVGTFFGGIDYYSTPYNNFELFYPIAGANAMKGFRIREFYPDPNGTIWIGSEDEGLNLFDPASGKFLPLPKALSSIHTNIHALEIDGDYLWIGTFSRGLNRYNRKTGALVTYRHSENNPKSISSNSTFVIHRDRQNTLWIGNLSGLDIYNYEDDAFSPVKRFDQTYIQDIFEDTQGNIWISTFKKGLHRYDPLTNKWSVFLYDASRPRNSPYNKLTGVFEDSRKRLWVTTDGGGFYLFDRETEVFKIFNSSSSGLTNDVIYSMEEDDEGYFWLSTNKGLVQFDPEKQVFKNYTVENGLKTNQFNYRSSCTTPDGNIYFGSIDGFVRFDPSKFKDNSKLCAPIVFTDFYINDKPVSPQTDHSPLKQSMLYADEIVLPYKQNSFSIRYSVLDYSAMLTDKISYKLEGFDKEWIKAENKQPIVYSNLRPGRYRLTVRLNGDAQTDPAITAKDLDIYIRPPFWMSAWAYLIYGLASISILALLIYFLNFREKQRHRLKMSEYKQQKERELYQSKIDFFTNVAHEIRTPLSLIKGPLDYVLLSNNVPDNVRDNLQIMSKNTDRLLDLTNQLLDFRKTESDVYLLNPKLQNASELIRETFLRFTPMAKSRRLSFNLDLPDQEMFVRLDKDAFLKIISNLLNNAVKYCDRYIDVKSCLSKTNDDETDLHFIVENDGELIPPDYKDEIFKPFVAISKEKKNEKIPGTGIGLALARSLAELHAGTLSLEPDPHYNRFHLVIPSKKPKADNVGAMDISGENEPVVVEVQKSKKKEKEYPCTILLVEDDAELLAFEKQILAAQYRVLIAENALVALDLLKTEPVHLIVSDVMMPKMDGFEFTRRVKSDINFSHIPIILLTAKTNVQSKVEGLGTGADAYIEKPFSVEVLTAQVSNLIESREKLRETYLNYPFVGVNSLSLTELEDEFIRKLQAIVQYNIADPNFDAGIMAEKFNMSSASLYRKLKGVMDLSPNEYIRIERLKKAARLLKEKTYKVNEICFMVGFNSPSYFAKCFYKQFGVLPKDFE
ncbi:MAG: response regulator [Dysgonamonadaceae bacterium]|jgi:ligand-binding sensor domain-containing protein/signal transduction histidine kinase/CheY-like chemotaxis protein/AraC-like DNA-binding protein|nr:response regulator [Dysgonamonadaceae bacterium]